MSYQAKDATSTAVYFDTVSGDGSGGSPYIAKRGAVGDVAHDAADAGNPVKIGGKGLSADPTAVTTADRVNALFDLIGRLVVAPYALGGSIVRGVSSALTTTTAGSVVAAPAGSLRNHITSVVIHNDDATPTVVNLTDGSGGATVASYYLAANGQVVHTLPVPIRLSAATALFAVCVTTGASVVVSAQGYTGV